MIFAVYQLEDGRLVSCASDAALVASAEILAARGYSVKQLPDGSQNGAWNAATLEFDPAPPPSAVIATHDFIMRFTAAEFGAIQAAAAANPQISQWLLALGTTQTIDLANPILTGAVGSLASAGLLTAARATAILEP